MHHVDANKTYWEKNLKITTQECCKQYWTSPGDSTPQNSYCTATYHLSRKLSKLDEADMRDTAGEIRTSSYLMYSCGSLHRDEERQEVKHEPTYCNSVQIMDVARKTSQKQWTIGRGGERVSEISVLIARYDDDIYIYIYTHTSGCSLGEMTGLRSRIKWVRLISD